MGKPREPGPNPGRPRATPEYLAKTATDRRRSPPGQPEKAVIVLRLALQRGVLERIATRAIRENVRIETVVEEILESAAK